MTLFELVHTLKTEVLLTVADLEEGTVLAELKSSGISTLDDVVENRRVARWTIDSATHITVQVAKVLVESNQSTSTDTQQNQQAVTNNSDTDTQEPSATGTSVPDNAQTGTSEGTGE